MRLHRTVSLFCAFALCVFSASAQTDLKAGATSSPAAANRPRVALVLSGGGARGFAHIGVLRVLRELHVPVDMVVGTSMGAVIGGAYAAGRTVEELEQNVHDTPWESVLADRPARYDLNFRRKEEDLLLPSRIEFAVSGSGVSLPPAAAGNAALETALARLLPADMRNRPLDRLALPFRSVASDLVSGELVELVDTPLFLSLRASLAVPGVFAPVRINNHLVVDGGLVRNLPVDMAHAMGADVVIAVNVGTPLAQENELGSAIGVAQQMLQILTEQNVQRSIKELRPRDILIAPDLNGVGFLDFGRQDQSRQAGEAAARRLMAQLQQLSVTPAEYATLESKRSATPADASGANIALPLAKLEVQGTPHINPQILMAQTDLRQGELATVNQIQQAAGRLYGRGDLDNVETEVSDEAGQRHVLIKPVESVWARNRTRIGLELASDFADNNRFSLGLMHVASSLNSYGAELRTVARVGTARQLATQLWQPLAPGSPWYVAPSLEYGASTIDLFNQGRAIYRVSARTAGATLVVGRELSNWGDVQVGITRQFGRYAALVPEDPALALRAYNTVQFAQLRVDTLDSLAFPSRGQLLMARWERSSGSPQDESSLNRSSVIGLAAVQSGEWAGHVYGEWSQSQRGTAPTSLGGFLRLSGTTPDSLDGRSVALARLVLARRIGAMPTGLGGAIRLGFSAELGGGFDSIQSFHGGSLKQAGSGFVSVDTRFGPLFFGAGATRGNGSTLYLFLGPIW